MQLVRPHPPLVETNEGTPGDPNSIVLALEVDEPDVAAEVITPEKVEGHFDIGDDPATQVVIRAQRQPRFRSITRGPSNRTDPHAACHRRVALARRMARGGAHWPRFGLQALSGGAATRLRNRRSLVRVQSGARRNRS